MDEQHRLTDGVSANAIRTFLKDLQHRFGVQCTDMTTEVACKQFVVPCTMERNCAYVELVRRHSPADVGKATVFVSHAWRYQITDVLRTLLEFADEQERQGGEPIFFWFDLFMNNQNANVTANLPQDWWSTTFKDSIASIGRLLLVLMPWDDPVPLTRAWCLWEIFCGISNKGTEVDIRLPQREEKALEKAIRDNYEAVTDMLVRVDAQRAEARSEHDKAMIFQAIETSAGGFGAVNQAIKDKMRAWCLSKAIAAVETMQQRGQDGTQAFASLCTCVGVVLDDFGETDRAITYWKTSLTIFIRMEGHTSQSVAGLFDSLGSAYYSKGEYDKAIEHHEKAREILVETHRSTADVDNNLGNAYRSKGEYDKAIEYYEKSLAITRETLGEKHRSTAATYVNLGVVYKNKGEYDKAIEYFEKAREIQVEVLGQKHPITAGTFDSLGNAYAGKGEYDKAIEYHDKAREMKVEALGEKHPSTAGTYNNLADAYRSKGEYDKAIEYFEEAREIYAEALGEKHPTTAGIDNNLGLTYAEKGDYDKAIEYYQKAREAQVETLGENHRSTADTYDNLGSAYAQKGEYDKAIEYCEKACEIKVEVLGEKHPSTGNTYSNLGVTYYRKGKYDKAIEYFQKARGVFVEMLGQKHPNTAGIYNSLGNVYADKGEYDNAIEYYEKAREIFVEMLGERHPSTAATYDNLGNAYSSKGEYDKAIEHFKKAREIKVETLGEKHPDTAMTLGNIGLLHRDRGDIEQAIEYTQRALDIFEETLGSQHPHTRKAKATLQQLLRHGSDAMQPKQGKSSLLTACRDGNMDVLSSLLRQGENPSQRDDNGNTPLHIACHLNHRDAAETLLQHGADPSLTNSKGETPLDVARSRDNTSVLRLLRSSRLDTVAGYDEGKKQHNQPDNGAGGEADEMLLAKQQKEKAQQLKKRGILEQMKRMAERSDAEPCNRAKLMLVGEGRSGKTTTLNSLLGKAFTPSLTSTRGATEDDLHVTVNARDVFLWKELRGNSSETAHHLLRACLGDPSAMNEYRRQQIQKAVGRKRTSTEQQVKRDWQQESIHWNEEDWQPTSAGFGAAQHEAAPAVSDDDPLFHAQSSRRRPRHRSRRRRRLPDAPTPTPPAMGRTDLEKVIEDVDISAALDDCIGRLIFKIFDLGGQSTFYIFHPLFLTEYAIYLLVFSMADMRHENEAKRVETWDFIEYWLTSLHLHANGASILIVGTYADVFAERSQHESISREMNERFLDHPAFDNVVENKKGELCFWPVDNTQSENDPMIQNLRTTVSATAMEQEYVSQRVALPYLQLYDKMMEVYKTQNKPLVTLDEVVELARTCGLPTRDETVECLRFLHLYSMLLYYDSVEGMEQFVILSPQWAADLMTRVIRKFDLHRDVRDKNARSRYRRSWEDLIHHGILRSSVLAVLWSDVREDLRQPFLELMIRYGLCVEYQAPPAPGVDKPLSRFPPGHGALASGEQLAAHRECSSVKQYLVPAILPMIVPDRSISKNSRTSSPLSSVMLSRTAAQHVNPYPGYEEKTAYVCFYMQGFKRGASVDADQLESSSFLPEGLFTLLLAHVMVHAQHGASQAPKLSRTKAVLFMESTKLELQLVPCVGGIKIMITSAQPRAVLDAVHKTIQQAVLTHYRQLKSRLLLPHSKRTLLLFEDVLYHCKHKKSLWVDEHLVSSDTLVAQYGSLLPLLGPQDQYDVFLSYKQWINNGFVMSLNPLLEQHGLAIFLDANNLETGLNFKLSFMEAIGHSLVACPVVSVDALKRMKELQHTDVCDNELLEWMTMLALRDYVRVHKGEAPHPKVRLRRVIPLFLGPQWLNASSALYESNSLSNMKEAASQLPDHANVAATETLNQYFEQVLKLPKPRRMGVRETVLSLFDIDGVMELGVNSATSESRNALHKLADMVKKAVAVAKCRQGTTGGTPPKQWLHLQAFACVFTVRDRTSSEHLHELLQSLASCYSTTKAELNKLPDMLSPEEQMLPFNDSCIADKTERYRKSRDELSQTISQLDSLLEVRSDLSECWKNVEHFFHVACDEAGDDTITITRHEEIITGCTSNIDTGLNFAIAMDRRQATELQIHPEMLPVDASDLDPDAIVEACKTGSEADVFCMLEESNIHPKLVHAEDEQGIPLLWCACEAGMPEVVEELIICGADTRLRSKTGQTVREFAELKDWKLVLRALEDTHMEEPDPEVETVLASIRNGTCGDSVPLQGMSIDVPKLEEICRALSSRLPITSLKLPGCRLHWKSAGVLGRCLPNLQHLTTLQVTANRLGDEGARLLSQAFHKGCAIEILDLATNHIQAKGAAHVAGALLASSQLSAVRLTDNPVGEDGARALALGTHLRRQAGHAAASRDIHVVLADTFTANKHLQDEYVRHMKTLRLNEELVQACQSNDTRHITRLLDNGANPNSVELEVESVKRCAQNDRDDPVMLLPTIDLPLAATALHVACKHGSTSVVKLLLDRGARPIVRDVEGNTPLDVAEQHGHDTVVDMLRAASTSATTSHTTSA